MWVVLFRKGEGFIMNRIEVKGKNIEVTPALKEYAEKKIVGVLDHFEQEGKGIVRLEVVRDSQIVEVTVTVGGVTIRGEERQPDMYSSIDLVADKLERQIRKYKTKLAKRIRVKQIENESAKQKSMAPVVEETAFPIARTKQVSLTPMSEEEAILQMNLLQHDFFVYLDADSNGVNVVYRRRHDEKYGLLELEY